MEVIKNVQTLKNYIGGQWIESIKKKKLKMYQIQQQERYLLVPISSKEDLDQAVSAAKKLSKHGAK